MTPESIFFIPKQDLETEDFNFRNDLNRLAAQAIGSFERVLREGGTEEVELGFKKPPYFTYKLDFTRGFAFIAGIHYLDGETGEIMGGEAVLNYRKAEKREEFIKAKDERGIDRFKIKLTVDPQYQAEAIRFDADGRIILDIEFVSWETKKARVRVYRDPGGEF